MLKLGREVEYRSMGRTRQKKVIYSQFFRVMPLWGIDAVTIRLSMFLLFRVMMPYKGIDAVKIRLRMFFLFLFFFLVVAKSNV